MRMETIHIAMRVLFVTGVFVSNFLTYLGIMYFLEDIEINYESLLVAFLMASVLTSAITWTFFRSELLPMGPRDK